MLPFGLAKDLVKETAVFDSAQSEQVKDKLSDMDYKALVADIANIRGWALSIVLDVIDAIANKYQKPTNGIPEADLDLTGFDGVTIEG